VGWPILGEIKRVGERPSDDRLDIWVAIDGDRLAAEEVGEDANVVQSKDVVGVMMRQQYRVSVRDFFSQELLAQVGAGVHQDAPLARPEESA
jgi:hypothetical protein